MKEKYAKKNTNEKMQLNDGKKDRRNKINLSTRFRLLQYYVKLSK